jgi:hypothetical protein
MRLSILDVLLIDGEQQLLAWRVLAKSRFICSCGLFEECAKSKDNRRLSGSADLVLLLVQPVWSGKGCNDIPSDHEDKEIEGRVRKRGTYIGLLHRKKMEAMY